MTVALSDLLAGIEDVALDGDPSTSIVGVTLDSRAVRQGYLFAALRGARKDGRTFIPDALASGAAAVLSETPPEATHARAARVAWLRSADPRKALGLISRNYHGRPDETLKVIGVTGTNGKTTVASLIAEILREGGFPAGLIGTVGYRIGDREIAADRTTPEAPELHRLLAEMVAVGCRHAVVEVSSHALALERVAGLRLAAAVFTNLTRDHLDFHGNIESYAAAKRRLFSERLVAGGLAVAGGDDPRGAEMLQVAAPRARKLTFGLSEGVDVRVETYAADFPGTDFRLELPGGELVEGRTPLPGRPGVLNLAAAVAVACGLGLDGRRATLAAQRFRGVSGRFERIDRGQPFAVIVDYAHTDDALANLLLTVREIGPRRVITVFGCGGDRDRTKRAPMGAAAIRHSDIVFLTSDNPRSEDPASILREVETGIAGQPGHSGRYRVFPDRREAIFAAIASAEEGDAVVIAGKGHETVQIFADRTVPFDDRFVAAEAIEVRLGNALRRA